MTVHFLYDSMYVKRWHTHAYVEQTVGQHSVGMLALLLVAHPNPSADLMKAVILHDASEKFTGDWPHEFKRKNPELRESEKACGLEWLKLKGIEAPELSTEDQLWLEFLDQAEVHAFICHMEDSMGSIGDDLRDIADMASTLADFKYERLKGYGYFK